MMAVAVGLTLYLIASWLLFRSVRNGEVSNRAIYGF
jgi:hypothetical protein